MESIEQLYNRAKRTYIIRLTLFTIIPYSLLTFSISYLFLNTEIATINILLRAFISSIGTGILMSFIIMITVFKKSKVLKHFNILYKPYANIDRSLLLLLSFYLIQNKKVYRLEKPHYFNKQMRFLSKSFGILYNKDTDEDIVKEILIFSKNTNFEE
ncbi:MAG: hypothetical protein B6I18_05275 [Bacteroidetes bacterium 4572_112]|nr:MAG: hypothetical protein B6I18_05275 [Bacteroidetes bacterium 4572_112]